jgi:hypothetical protein
MKITKLVAMMFAVGVLTTSCTKDYQCECTNNGFTSVVTFKDSKKAAAYAACEQKGIGSVEVAGQKIENNSNCKIK